MKKLVTILIISIISCVEVFAQQDPQFTLFPWASIYYNAGTIGDQKNTLCFTALFRQQYMGFKDVYTDESGNEIKENTAPQDLMFSIETYARKLHGGIGLTVIRDKIGYYNNIGVKLGYAFKLNVGPGTLGIGVQLGLLNQKLDGSKLRPVDASDPVLSQITNQENFMDMDINFGVSYKAERWYAGIGATQLIEKLRLTGSKDFLGMSRHLYFHGGYIFIFPNNPSWTLEPQALIKTDLATAQLDLMVLSRYNGIFWFGASYRIQDAVSLMFGARPFYNSSNNFAKGLDVGLAYSFTTSKLGFKKNRSFGDIEIMLRYCFDIYRTETFSGYGSTRNIYKNQY
ncbi:MAG: PorP/SprF family type IX secretion system membrane protein [Bacteroidales bacterium]|jgi:type IX secretion system PorP/SprF family membrane protein|nr:PorP/SprF family type IX secretion system membrane protein [Bacteroidales bacterium]MBR4218257.1 PorP/SprF family type IX secretion system membrane protein [Bacteroidales bacterium]